MITQSRISSRCTQCDSPTPSLEKKISLPTLHRKLKLAKQFIKALKSDSKTFNRVQALFLKLSEAKIKADLLTGPHIRQMLGCKEMTDKITALERDAWPSFCNVLHGYLRNKADNHEDLV